MLPNAITSCFIKESDFQKFFNRFLKDQNRVKTTVIDTYPVTDISKKIKFK